MLLTGEHMVLRQAVEDDRRTVYEWMAESEITKSMMGPPRYSDIPIPNWEQFCSDYSPQYFNGSDPMLGKCFVIEVAANPVGVVSYNDVDERNRRTELDIWMNSESNCGKGYGPYALKLLMEYLHRELGITEFVIRPSARNTRAIRAYLKAGFERLEIETKQEVAEYGPGECGDSVVLVKQTKMTDTIQ